MASTEELDPRLEHCQFANWYKFFKSLTPRTRILEAPEEFREYLLSDGIKLREEPHASSDSEWESLDVEPVKATELKEDSHSEIESDSDTENDIMKEPPTEFHESIERTIASLHGEVAPKLNWSAPVDSKWMLPSNTMRCTSANDIYMLLKSSDYVNHDLKLSPPQVTLVLREWFNLHPSTEFRCFVRDRQLVAVSQRDMNYYDFLETARSDIERLSSYITSLVSSKFPDASYVCDIHIPLNGDRTPSRPWLIDINPWLEQTDSILFTWDELSSLQTTELRLVEKADRSRSFASKPHSASQVPYDFVDMPRSTLEEMLTQMKSQRQTESVQNQQAI